MTPSIAATHVPQSTKARRSAARPVIPVIPLHYLKKKPITPAINIATSPKAIEPSQEVSVAEISEPVTLTPAASPPSAAHSTVEIKNGTSNQDPESKKEEAATSPVLIPEENGLEETEENSVELKERSKWCGDNLKVADESDKSSTLANESRPATTEPTPSSFTMPPAFYSAVEEAFYPAVEEKVHQHDDSASSSSRDAAGQFPIDHTHPDPSWNLDTPATSGCPKSRSSSPRPSGLGDPQFQHPSTGPVLPGNVNGHVQPYPNTYAPMGPPPPPGFFQPQDPRIVRRQMPNFTSPDGYSPPPSITPVFSEQQRFPSYPSSVQNEFDGNGQPVYNQFAAPVGPNGANGHVDDMHVNQQPRHRGKGSQSSSLANGSLVHQRHMHPQLPPHAMRDHLDGLLEYLCDQFNDPTFADYVLELHYSDCRAQPVRIPGHNLLFARSPVLNNLMAGQLGVDRSKRLLRLETDDRFVTSEGFHMAVSRLYGGQLLDEGGSIARTPRDADSQLDRFNLALGYAAAGHILHISPVVDRGIMVATNLISWNTVEKAVDFAIEGGLDSQWTFEPGQYGYSRSTYGRLANDLLTSALYFTLGNFPANFELDTSAPDFAHNSRLPVIQVSGIQTYRPVTANPRLSSIKFGDFTISNAETVGTSPRSVLSKLLIALPFHLLKYVLEHPRLGNVEGWATAKLRQKVIHTVVEEREKRRMKVANSPISNSKRLENRTQWEAVGWKEHILPTPGSPDLLTINRTWVDFTVRPES